MFRSKISDVCIKDQYTLLEGAMGIVPKCTETRPQNAHLCGLIGRFGDISAFWDVNSAEWRVKYVAGGDGGGGQQVVCLLGIWPLESHADDNMEWCRADRVGVPTRTLQLVTGTSSPMTHYEKSGIYQLFLPE